MFLEEVTDPTPVRIKMMFPSTAKTTSSSAARQARKHYLREHSMALLFTETGIISRFLLHHVRGHYPEIAKGRKNPAFWTGFHITDLRQEPSQFSPTCAGIRSRSRSRNRPATQARSAPHPK
jgi:hypothetical protein